MTEKSVHDRERPRTDPIPYLENSNSVAGEDSEGVKCLFSRSEKRYFLSETV